MKRPTYINPFEEITFIEKSYRDGNSIQEIVYYDGWVASFRNNDYRTKVLYRKRNRDVEERRKRAKRLYETR